MCAFVIYMKYTAMIYFTKHAEEKFDELKRHGFFVSRHQVTNALDNPEHIDYSRFPQLIAQCKIDSKHVLRVVYKMAEGNVKVITFYIGRMKQYAKENSKI